jgi:hypothetical protein
MSEIEEKERDLALRRYDTILKFHIYESTIYWTRNQFFGLLNAALLAFFAAVYRDGKYELIFITTLGAVTSLLWVCTIFVSDDWLRRWQSICVQLEPLAFGDIDIFRNIGTPGRWGDHIKWLAKAAAFLSFATWIIVIGFTAWKLAPHSN